MPHYHYSYVVGDYYIYSKDLVEIINQVDIERRMRRDDNGGQKLSTNFKQDLLNKMNIKNL